MLIPTALAAIFVSAIFAPTVCRVMGSRAGWVLGCVPLAAFFLFLTLLPGVGAGGTVRVVHEWVPSLGISLSFFVDGLSLLFLLVISLIGTFVVWYASGYLHGSRDIGAFYVALLGFMGSMLGLVAADNLILLFVFWELTSITSYLLIGYYGREETSRKSALQALLVTGGGGLAMLAGFILLAQSAGRYEISEILALPVGQLAAAPGFGWVLGLILLGAFTKSAQFPFHFWLPSAMAAPAPVSAFLHSATMVKAGVFLMARLFPALSPSEYWMPVVATVGAVTMLTGVVLALGQSDLKKILAYTTLAVLGTLTMLLGIGTELAVKAAMAYLLAHALYKAALFMAVGSVDHETGTREVASLGGLRSAMPFTAAAALLAALSMAGLPFLLGFVSKEYFYKALLDAPGPPGLWEVLGVSASIAMVGLAGTAGVAPFFGRSKDTPKHPHEASLCMWIGPLILGVAAVKFGIFPGVIGNALIVPASGSVLGDTEFSSSLKLWHGFTVALGLSVITVALGAVVYFRRNAVRQLAARMRSLARIGPEAGYEALLAGTLRGASGLTSLLQSGYLRNYILIVGGFFVLLVATRLPENVANISFHGMSPPELLPVVVCVVASIAGVMACLVRSRFAAIMALGAVGICVAMLYFLFSAPDLAMTQILVETLTLVLFVAAFHRLPLLKEYSAVGVRLRDAVLCGIFGVVMCLLVLVAFHFDSAAPPVSGYMGENSLPLANGRNVVNVILVDFRALDTLGEITVLAIAALGVFAMLRLKPSKDGEEGR